jgi:hypothetical protein
LSDEFPHLGTASRVIRRPNRLAEVPPYRHPYVYRGRELATLGESAPVIDETCAMLYEVKDLRHAVRDLMARELKAED